MHRLLIEHYGRFWVVTLKKQLDIFEVTCCYLMCIKHCPLFLRPKGGSGFPDMTSKNGYHIYGCKTCEEKSISVLVLSFWIAYRPSAQLCPLGVIYTIQCLTLLFFYYYKFVFQPKMPYFSYINNAYGIRLMSPLLTLLNLYVTLTLSSLLFLWVYLLLLVFFLLSFLFLGTTGINTSTRS